LRLDAADENDRIKVTHRSANATEVELHDLPDYRVLSFIDFAYPGWHVYVDGIEAPLMTAFSYFKAVEVPPGTHRVRFEFRPRTAYFGIALSCAGALMAALVANWGLRRPAA
jgi:uncharacterized membrane protein YfhO